MKGRRRGSPVQVCWVKRIDNSRLVRQRDPGYVRESAALLGGALICLAVVLLCAWQHFQCIHAGYRLEELRAEHERVLEWNRTLHLEQAALLDPMRIDGLARNRLGLGDPSAGQVIPLGSGQTAVLTPVLARAEGPAGTGTAPTPPVRPPPRVSLAD